MHVTPSGNPKRMEQQQYISGTTASSMVEEMIKKVADTLDLGQDTSQFLQPKTDPAAQTGDMAPKGNPPAENADVQNTMNQSSTLPQEQQTGYQLANYDPSNEEHKVLAHVLDVIGKHSITPVASGVFEGQAKIQNDAISITFIRVKTEGTGTKQIEHP